MNDRLLALRLFVAVASERSVARGARSLGLTQAAASKMIAELERSLETKLFASGPQPGALTKRGEAYLHRILRVLDALDQANGAARRTNELRGKLRIGSTSAFADRVLIPWLSRFVTDNPAIEIDLVVNDQKQDLIGENLDIALRLGPLVDSGTIAKRIGAWPLMIAASPSYLDRAGTPTTPSDLSDHMAILLGACTNETWIFRKDGHKATVRLAGQVKTSSSNAAVEAARAGLGIFRSIAPVFTDAIRDGDLTHVLADWTMATVEVHALFPGNQAPKPSARAFVNYVEQGFRTVGP